MIKTNARRRYFPTGRRCCTFLRVLKSRALINRGCAISVNRETIRAPLSPNIFSSCDIEHAFVVMTVCFPNLYRASITEKAAHSPNSSISAPPNRREPRNPPPSLPLESRLRFLHRSLTEFRRANPPPARIGPLCPDSQFLAPWRWQDGSSPHLFLHPELWRRRLPHSPLPAPSPF